MKKIISVLLMVALIATVAIGFAACGEEPASSSDTGLKTVESGKLHMATNAAFPPYEMLADDGVGYEGIDVEVATEIATMLGLELIVDDMDFSSVITAVQEGKSDIAMAGLTVTDERKLYVDFTDTYAKGIQVIIVKEGSSIVDVDGLDGAKIGTQEGTTGYNYCSAAPEDGGYGEDNVVAYQNGATAIQALLNGQVDCVVIDNEPAKEFVKANAGLKILETEFANEDYAIGVSKENNELLTEVNNALKTLIDNGTVQKIVDKYINAN